MGMKLLSSVIGCQAIWTERPAKSQVQMLPATVRSHKQQVLEGLASRGPLHRALISGQEEVCRETEEGLSKWGGAKEQ